MSSTRQWPAPPGDRLTFLAETVIAAAALLRITDVRVFALPMDAERAGTLRHDIELAERVDAFEARFGRLLDTTDDKLLPAVLAWLSEPVGTDTKKDPPDVHLAGVSIARFAQASRGEPRQFQQSELVVGGQVNEAPTGVILGDVISSLELVAHRHEDGRILVSQVLHTQGHPNVLDACK